MKSYSRTLWKFLVLALFMEGGKFSNEAAIYRNLLLLVTRTKFKIEAKR